MSATPSKMLPLGTPAPDFALPEVASGRLVRPSDFSAAQPLLVMFVCRHCPFVVHVQQELARLGRDYQGRVGMAAISANDAEAYPDDAPASLAAMVAEQGFVFPLLYDESQAAARAYGAACTPDFFLFDTSRRLAYRGQLDDSRPGNGRPVTGHDLRAALDALLAGQAVSPEQRPSLGCNIKWKG
ncbi:MAG TPA: thioredoxin family protein [Terriglobales bacterium]|nr:thioredoxin family protein [Terriglobales bacterium]